MSKKEIQDGQSLKDFKKDDSSVGAFQESNLIEQVGAGNRSMATQVTTAPPTASIEGASLDSKPIEIKAQLKGIQKEIMNEAHAEHKDEKCEKCGSTGHTMDKCWMGKSLRDIKKNDVKKDAFPMVDNSTRMEKGACKKCGEKGHTLDKCMSGKSLKEMKKSSVKQLRDDMANGQGMGLDSEGKVPKVKQDHATGVKTLMNPPQANEPVKKPVAPKRQFVQGIRFKKSDDEHMPDQEDIFFTPHGTLGAKTSASAGGKHLGVFNSDEEAHDAARKWSKTNNFHPNAWSVSDHGNHHLIENFHNPPKAKKMKKSVSLETGMSLNDLRKAQTKADQDYKEHTEKLVKSLPQTAEKAREVLKKIKK